jgi:hypothetical protein
MRTGEDPETAKQGTGEFNHWHELGTVVGAAAFQLQEFQTLARCLMYNLTTLSSLGYSGYRFPWPVCLLNSAPHSSGLSYDP